MYYFKQRINNQIVSVEAKSIDIASPDFSKTTKVAYDNFIKKMPTPIPPIDWKELYKKADTTAAKMAIMAQRLGLAE